ncbi:MAG: Hsp70 family protein [Deltaproteobacteria bacterium]|nr:Hsp70 family protein [Deltaproteobacteria bacterium]
MSNPVAVGIDLGTSNSVVAVAQGGQPRVLTNPEGFALVPSVISFGPDGRTLIGAPAKAARAMDPENTVFSVKRLMGRPFDTEEVRRAAARFAFRLERGPDQAVLVRTRAGTHTLPELSALVLREVRRVAEAALGQPIGRAVITVPANFNELQRSATKLAGQIADFDVARILNEPTAAALAYGYGRGTRERIAVFDFGGGTFDVTLLELSGNVFEVLATAGDTFLGGDDIDLAMTEGLADAATKTLRIDAVKDRRVFEILRASAEQAKIDLSSMESSQIRIPNIATGPGGRALEFRTRVTRGEFEKVAQPYVQRTIDVCAEALKLAGLKPADFGAVILVGGSSQMPLVRKAVRDFFKAEPHTALPPETVVATGAAILAEALGGKRTKITGHSRSGKLPSAPPPGASASDQDANALLKQPVAPRSPSISESALPAISPGRSGAAYASSIFGGAAPGAPAPTDPSVNAARGTPPRPPMGTPAYGLDPNLAQSNTSLPALRRPDGSPVAGTAVFGGEAPRPASVADLPALQGSPGGTFSDLPAIPRMQAPAALSVSGLPAVKIDLDLDAAPSVALPAAPVQRGRMTTEPQGLGAVVSSLGEGHSDLPKVSPAAQPPSSPTPRMRTRTITHSSAATPPPAPHGASSSIAPPRTGDLSWSTGQSQPPLATDFDDDELDNTKVRDFPAIMDDYGDEPTSMRASSELLPKVSSRIEAKLPKLTDMPVAVPALRPRTSTASMGPSARSAPPNALSDLPAMSPPKPPSVSGSSDKAKIESNLPTFPSVDTRGLGGAQPPGLPATSAIRTQPSIGANLPSLVSTPSFEEPPESVTTLKRISTLITEADEDLPAAVPSRPRAFTPPAPFAPPPLPPPTPASANAVGRRTAVMIAATPPPPPTPSIAQPPPPLRSQVHTATFETEPGSMLMSSKGLSADELGFDAEPAPPLLPMPDFDPLPAPPLAPPLAPFAVYTPPAALQSAVATAPLKPLPPSGASGGTGAPLPFAQSSAPAPYAPPQATLPPLPDPMPAPTRPMGTMPAPNAPRFDAPAHTPLLLDVTPQSLRVETVGGLSQTVIARNSTIPLEQTRAFATAYDNQQEVRIRIAQGESARFGENQPLGELELSGLRPANRGDVTIEVTFELDADGTLQVRARDTLTGISTEARINLLTMPTAGQTADMAQRQRN